MTLGAIWQGWRSFWFAPTGTASIGLYRILFGLLVLQVGLVHLGAHFEEWYGKNSMVPLPAVVNHFWHHEPRFDYFLLFAQTDSTFSIIYIAFISAAIFLCLGLFSNYSAAFIWLTLLSMHHQNPYNINGGDAFLRTVAPFLALSHCGDSYSVDALIAKKMGRPRLTVKNPWAQRMIQVQIALVYWQTFCCKMAGPQWLDGTAIYYATRLDDMMRFPAPWITDNMLVLKFLDYSTLVIEFLAWNAIFIKSVRYYILIGLVCLHLGIDYLINLPVFEWAFICTLVTFVESVDVENCLAAIAQPRESYKDWRRRLTPRKAVFEEIYANNEWGGQPGEFYSGVGSDSAAADQYVQTIGEFIAARSIPTVVDIGCGDFRVGSRIVAQSPDLIYIGTDIVETLIRRNQSEFGRANVSFVCLDAVSAVLPEGDLCLIRQVLQHLTNAEIASILAPDQKIQIFDHHRAPCCSGTGSAT